MRKVSMCVGLLLLLAGPAFAMSQITTFVIKDAHEYGKRFALEEFSNFMRPWTAFEEKAEALSEAADHAIVFTPYALIAVDVREKILNNRPIQIEASEKVLAQYDGYLVFSVTLTSPDHLALAKLTAVLIQDKRTIPAYSVSSPAKTQLQDQGRLLTRVQFYIYFPDREIAKQQPLLLIIRNSTDQARSFFFDLEKVL